MRTLPPPAALLLCALLALCFPACGRADEVFSINGNVPSLAATAASGPKRSECGIGALMPWADKLYYVSYLSVPNAGSGTGLYAVSENMTKVTVAEHNSTYANRLIHPPSNQMIMGAWAIDMHGGVKVFKDLLQVRIGGSALHLTDDDKMYMLSMDGPLFECNVYTMACTQLFDLVEELNIPKSEGEQPHFKAAHSIDGYLFVVTNTFEENDFVNLEHGGRLAQWKGPGTDWEVIEKTAFVEVTGRFNFGSVVYAVGWDSRSVILMMLDLGDSGSKTYNKQWQRYRLPKASHAFDHLWQTEWPRIREVETERYLLDMHGMFYELSPLGWAGSTWGVRPICQHVRVIPDYASFRGMFVAAGNEVSSIFDNNIITGQAQSGLWFGKTDDLWSWGKPKGWGGVWRHDNVTGGSVSDPYLMTGFDHKVAHVSASNIPSSVDKVTIVLEVDFLGVAGSPVVDPKDKDWATYKSVTLTSDEPYQAVVFPDGFSAHWIRARVAVPTGNEHTFQATVYFHYT